MTIRTLAGLSLSVALLAAGPAASAESYPFEGTWIRMDRVCAPTTVRARVYTAKEVTSPLGRCAIRRVASNGNSFELLEECRRSEHNQTITEIIRLGTPPDTMALRRQVSRLKIPRQVHYQRCSIAAGGAPSPAPSPRPTKPPPEPKG